ncbi:MAG: GHKL domain-containing protein [Pseudomonadales bacterium]|nr:GHKL domain-containing protein [Pseudomonadales bacterium]
MYLLTGLTSLAVYWLMGPVTIFQSGLIYGLMILSLLVICRNAYMAKVSPGLFLAAKYLIAVILLSLAFTLLPLFIVSLLSEFTDTVQLDLLPGGKLPILPASNLLVGLYVLFLGVITGQIIRLYLHRMQAPEMRRLNQHPPIIGLFAGVVTILLLIQSFALVDNLAAIYIDNLLIFALVVQAAMVIHLQHVKYQSMLAEGSEERQLLKQHIEDYKVAVAERSTELQQANKVVAASAHRAGMAEIATSLLHNIGNALNGVNTPIQLIQERLGNSATASLAKLVDAMEGHKADLGHFVTTDPQGKRTLEFLRQLSKVLGDEQQDLATTIQVIRKNTDHIASIIQLQQDYTHEELYEEAINVSELVDDVLLIVDANLQSHFVELQRKEAKLPELLLCRHKTMMVLVNLINNAVDACSENAKVTNKRVQLELGAVDNKSLYISISDNGVGFSREQFNHLFHQGYTTKKEGHGIGLHSSAIAAGEMSGELSAKSEGLGLGATFTLTMPLRKSLAFRSAE